jgi:hypothetical protein
VYRLAECMVKLHSSVKEMGAQLSTWSVLSTSVSGCNVLMCFVDILSGQVLFLFEVQFVVLLCNFYCPFPLFYCRIL